MDQGEEKMTEKRRRYAVIAVTSVVFAVIGALLIIKVIRPFDPYGKYISRGRQFFAERKWDVAAREFETASKIRPEGYEAHFGLGATYLKQRKLKLAVDELL